MKTKLPISITVTLSALYLLVLAVAILSLIRGGFAATSSGVPIPSDWLFFSFAIFLVFTAIQVILFHLLKDKYYNCGLSITLLKLIVSALSEVVIDCWYVFNPSYIANDYYSGFYATVWYTVLVATFLGLILIVAIVEIIGCIKLRKEAQRAKQ